MAIVLVLVVTAGTAAAVEDVMAAPSAGIATAIANAHLTRLATASLPTASRAGLCATWRRDDHPERVYSHLDRRNRTPHVGLAYLVPRFDE